MYFCTAANARYFDHLLNLIGSIHWTHYFDLEKIAVFDLGLTQEQRDYLNTIEKIEICTIEKVHPDIIKDFYVGWGDRHVPGWYAWKPVVIWQSLKKFPYVLWLDAGTTLKKEISALFRHIKQNGYFLATIGDEYHTVEWGMTKYVRQK